MADLLGDAFEAGKDLARRHLYGEAAERFELAAQAHPKHPIVLFRWGCALRRAGRNKEAAARLRECLEIVHAFPGAHSELGAAELKLGHSGEAEKLFRRALELDAHDCDAVWGLGSVHEARKQWREALEHFLKSLAMNPSVPKRHYVLVRLLISMGRAEDAFRHATATLKGTKFEPDAFKRLKKAGY